jgi:DNA-nicking Smr family endonuclease
MPPPAPRPDTPAADDGEVWRRFAAAVRPLAGAKRASTKQKEAAPVAASLERARPSAAERPPSAQLAPLAIGVPPAGLDRASWRRLCCGRTRPARRLDLHGLTAARALATLETFLGAAAAEGERTVEVITGRGTGTEGGVIRRELPHWLNRPALRPLVLGACHPHPANPGAVLLLLRRRR